MLSTVINADVCQQIPVRAKGLCLYTVALLVILFITPTTSVQAVSTYIDDWVDDYGVPPGTIYEEGDVRNGPYICGAGVTRIAYYEPYHDAAVDVTVRSPNGRSITATTYADEPGYKQPWLARAETFLLWGGRNDIGEYLISSRHYSLCPGQEFGSRQVGLIVGASVNSMRQLSPGSRSFRTISPCNVICRLDGFIGRTGSYPCAYVLVPSIQGVCLLGSVVTYGDFPCGGCTETISVF